MSHLDLTQRFSTLDDAAAEREAIALGEQSNEGWQQLLALREADDADARFWAVRGLWANGSDEAIRTLIEMVRDNDEMVRSGAALALGELKAETAVDALAERLIHDAGPTGDHAADALSKIGSPAADVLIEAMAHESPHVRVRAAKALGPIEARKSIRVLFEALEDDSYMVRHYAEIALARMGVGQVVYFKP